MDQTKRSNASEFQGAYSQLEAMRSHIPGIVSATLVEEYNGLLDELQGWYGRELARFRIADSELRPVCHSGYMNDFYLETYTNVYGAPECDQDLFLQRIDGLLRYLQAQNPAAKPAIGFVEPVR